MQIHADTNQAQQQYGFTVELNPMTTAPWRVKQYTDSNGEAYEDVVPWMAVNGSGPQMAWIPINKNAVKAGGNTIMELRLNPAGGAAKMSGMASLLNHYTYITSWVPETRLARVCDDKDNYRFGFNGKEKDNEVKGIGNSIDFGERIFDSRLGRWLSLDPLAEKYPSVSPYNYVLNNPICATDPDGKLVMFIGGLRLAVGQGDQRGYGYPTELGIQAVHHPIDLNRGRGWSKERKKLSCSMRWFKAERLN